MAELRDLRETARKLEQARRWNEALSAYEGVLAASEGEEVDPALLNRVGDLRVRAGEADGALALYERAAEAYRDARFHNNAIALCRKILRLAPGRIPVYLTLGRLHAANGFLADARGSYLEYAGRAGRVGQVDASLEALRELANLTPEDVEVRELLAGQLHTHGRRAEAVEQLRVLMGVLGSRGAFDRVEAVRDRIRQIDPAAHSSPLELPGSPTPCDRAFDELSWGADPLPPAFGGEEREAEAATRGGDEEGEDDSPFSSALEVSKRISATDTGRAAVELEEDAAELEPLGLDLEWPIEGEAEPRREFEIGGCEPHLPEAETASPDAPASIRAEEAYVDLRSLVLEDHGESDGRVRFDVAPEARSGIEEHDLAAALAHFGKEVTSHLPPRDHITHYDLGLAFRSMGMLDEAIARLQTALLGGASPLPVLEALGLCFMEKGQPQVAGRIFARALDVAGAEESELIGILYHFGRCEEATGRLASAAERYERVLAVDISFRDAADRLTGLSAG